MMIPTIGAYVCMDTASILSFRGVMTHETFPDQPRQI